MMKKIFALITAVCILCTSVAFADVMSREEIEKAYLSDLIAPERLLKYDYSTEEDEEAGESLEFGDAVTVVTALGIMEYMEDGTFNETAAVKKSEFSKLLVRLSMGDVNIYDGDYDRYSDTEFVTQNEASHYFAVALGYDALVYDAKGEWPYLTMAQKIGLFDGIKYTGAKNITRGELAQMIYNAFTVDMVEQTEFSYDASKFEKIKGKTLIQDRFDAIIIEGVVTAQNGMNIYSELAVDKGIMEIDRVAYDVKGLTLDDMLGKRVIAVVADTKYGDSEVLGISVSQEDETVDVSFDDITMLQSGKMKYLSGNDEKTINISGVNHVVLNGVPYNNTALNYSHLIGDGEIRICMTGDSDKYTSAVIYSYTTACVSAVASFSEKLFIQGASRINGKDYVSLGGDKQIIATRDGEIVSPYDLSYNNVVSIMENPNDTVAYIKASSKTISGTITETDSEFVYIEGNPYRVSSGHKADAWPELEVGKKGTFYLDTFGKVLRFSPGDSEYIYGYLVGVDQQGSLLNKKSLLRMFTVNNKFEIFELAGELTLDGQNSVTSDAVYNKLSLKSDELLYQPVRYMQNAKGEIIFLDTVEDTTYDRGDKNALRLSHTFSGGLNWTASAKHTSLDNTTYNWNSTTPNFVIPTERGMEEEYIYRDGPSYVWNQAVVINLYSANEYDTASLLVEDKTVRSASVFTDGYRYACVTKLKKALNDDGDVTLAVEVLDGSNPPNFPRTTFVVHNDIVDKVSQLNQGDIIQMNIGSSVLKDFKMIAEAEWFHDSPKDIWIEPQGGRTEVLGTIESVDVGKGMIKVSGLVNGEKTYAIYTKQSLGLYDKSTDKNYDIVLGDLEPGDRVFCFGGVSLMRILAVRE